MRFATRFTVSMRFEREGVKMANEVIKRLLDAGYPYRIKGNDGYEAVLYDVQMLIDGDFCAIYMYPGGQCCHDINAIKSCFEVIEQYPA